MIAFIAASFAILLVPGPTNTLLATCGAAMGFRGGLVMTLAQAMGYLIATSFYVALAEHIRANPTVFFVLKTIAAVWLTYTAIRLWQAVFDVGFQNTKDAFLKVLITTIVNPKAMLVGVVLIAPEPGSQVYLWIATYATLSIFAGTAWVLLGSLLPLNMRRYSYKLASIVLLLFSITTIAG